MRKLLIFTLFVIGALSSFGQNNESVYALNYGVTTKEVYQGEKILFDEVKPFPNSSYIKIKQKAHNSFYIQTIVNGKFAYGHYFKFQNKIDEGYKYIRTDGNEIEYIITNYPLEKLALSNMYDEKITFKLINYRTSFAMLLKF
jgi:hypothetical protein